MPIPATAEMLAMAMLAAHTPLQVMDRATEEEPRILRPLLRMVAMALSTEPTVAEWKVIRYGFFGVFIVIVVDLGFFVAVAPPQDVFPEKTGFGSRTERS
jgi:hypothetical protein